MDKVYCMHDPHINAHLLGLNDDRPRLLPVFTTTLYNSIIGTITMKMCHRGAKTPSQPQGRNSTFSTGSGPSAEKVLSLNMNTRSIKETHRYYNTTENSNINPKDYRRSPPINSMIRSTSTRMSSISPYHFVAELLFWKIKLMVVV